MGEKIVFFKAYGLMWKNIFNYKSEASRDEYRGPVILNIITVVLLIAAFAALVITGSDTLVTVVAVLALYYIIAMIPFAALSVRRLHTLGKSGWWSCLLLIVGVGVIWLLSICVSGSSGSGFKPWDNNNVNVYGPPPFDVDESHKFNPEDNESVTVYGPPEWFENGPVYNPDENYNVEVYGPAEWFEGGGYDPDNNYNEVIYGPPEWNYYDEDSEYFNSSDNANVDVYGPPSWYDDSNGEGQNGE